MGSAPLLPADWPAPANVRAFTTLRHGAGVSAMPFDTFNLGARCGDAAEAVASNRSELIRIGGLPSAPVWLRQVHGTQVHRAGARPHPPFGHLLPQAGEGTATPGADLRLPLPLAGEGWGEGARAAATDAGNRQPACPHPPFGHLLPQAGEGTATATASATVPRFRLPLALAGQRPTACAPSARVGLRARAAGTGWGAERGWGGGARSAGPEADAAVTDVRGVVLAILTADCLPVLLCADDGSEIAAAHAGWRGLAAGVLEAAVAAMRTPPPRLLAWLGPAAGPQHYEVGAEVFEAFVASDRAAAEAFVATRPRHWRVDLYALARRRLAMAGVKADRIHGGGLCTISEPRRFYSHRRDGRSGRMASLIWIAP